MTEPQRVWFLVPGDLATPTGGYAYDRRIIAGLREAGWEVQLETLDPSFPAPSPAALADAARRLQLIPDRARVIVDGLAFGVLDQLAVRQHRRLRLIALVHHPLAYESGIDADRAAHLRASETRALSCAERVLATSQATADLLAEAYQVPRERLQVVAPGVDPAPLATGSEGDAPRLLCVATPSPRKGYDVLLTALGDLLDRPWTLDCVGDATRDPVNVASLLALRGRLGLAERVRFTGRVDAGRLDALYRRADLFVLATRFEGYGMVLTEALAYGLPVVSTLTGPIPSIVPPDAGVLVAPGDPLALCAALARLLDEPGARAALAAGARAARAGLRSWGGATEEFARAIGEMDERTGRVSHG